MFETFQSNQSPDEKKVFKISSLEDCVFNSKLFIDLDSTDEYSLNNSFEKDSENANEINDVEKDYLLIKELLEELYSPKSNSLEETNNLNYNKSLLPLIDNGYKFIPKGYKNDKDTKINKKNKKYNKYNVKNTEDYHNKQKTIKERKGDWICQLCLNLNFAFRKICNRCKTPKE